MWVVVEKLSTEATSDAASKVNPEVLPLVHLAYSVWLTQADHDAQQPPVWQNNHLIHDGDAWLPETKTRFVRDGDGNFVLKDGKTWTEADYIAEIINYRQGKREHPNGDIALETVAVDLVDEIKNKIIKPALEEEFTKGDFSVRKDFVAEKEVPEPSDKAEKPELKGLVGLGFEIVLGAEAEILSVHR